MKITVVAVSLDSADAATINKRAKEFLFNVKVLVEIISNNAGELKQWRSLLRKVKHRKSKSPFSSFIAKALLYSTQIVHKPFGQRQTILNAQLL